MYDMYMETGRPRGSEGASSQRTLACVRALSFFVTVSINVPCTCNFLALSCRSSFRPDRDDDEVKHSVRNTYLDKKLTKSRLLCWPGPPCCSLLPCCCCYCCLLVVVVSEGQTQCIVLGVGRRRQSETSLLLCQAEVFSWGLVLTESQRHQHYQCQEGVETPCPPVVCAPRCCRDGHGTFLLWKKG